MNRVFFSSSTIFEMHQEGDVAPGYLISIVGMFICTRKPLLRCVFLNLHVLTYIHNFEIYLSTLRNCRR